MDLHSIELIDGEVKHKKRSNTASRSNSNKRSDHKHKYEKIIIQNMFGFSWSKQCKVCGRIDAQYHCFSSSRHMDFIKNGSLNKPAISLRDYMSIDEIKNKYPGIKIYKQDKNLEYKEV